MAILGIDEAGRGPWAGPLVVGAVILGESGDDFNWLSSLTDSKKLTPKRREYLSPLILKHAACGLGWVSASELDELGMSEALRVATRRAVKNLKESGNATFSEIIIDGTQNFLCDTPLASRVTTLIKADAKIRAVSAASIIAKVARDDYMNNLAHKYPGYGFEKHKGYGTAAHQAALQALGPCPEHRFSFAPIRKLAGNEKECAHSSKTTTTIGRRAESVAAAYLESLGHTIIARNYRTKSYEIDLISTYNQDIFFTEVKYRKNDSRGDGLEAISARKREQITFAATAFLHAHPEFKGYTPRLAAASVSGVGFELQDFLVMD